MSFSPLFLAVALLAAQEASPPEKSMPSLPAAARASKEASSLLMIDPKLRAQDYIQASSTLLASVVDLSSSENGTLMWVKVPFSQGTKYLIVPIEDIKEIAYSP